MIQSVCNKNESCGGDDYSLGSVEFSPQKFVIRETSQPWSSDPSDMSFWTHSANSVVTRVSHIDRTIRADCYPGRITEMWLLSSTILIIWSKKFRTSYTRNLRIKEKLATGISVTHAEAGYAWPGNARHLACMHGCQDILDDVARAASKRERSNPNLLAGSSVHEPGWPGPAKI